MSFRLLLNTFYLLLPEAVLLPVSLPETQTRRPACRMRKLIRKRSGLLWLSLRPWEMRTMISMMNTMRMRRMMKMRLRMKIMIITTIMMMKWPVETFINTVMQKSH